MPYSQSKIKQFRRCQRQFAFRYDTFPGREMTPKVPSLPLHKGSWMHALNEAWRRQLAVEQGFSTDQVYGSIFPEDQLKWEQVHASRTRQFNGLFDEEKEKLGFDLPDECERLFRGYLRRWKDDSEKYRVATLKDGSPAIEMLVEWPLTKWGLEEPFKGRIDYMVEDLEYGGLWIWDNKWVRSIPPEDERVMSPQNAMYVWAARKMGYDVRGFLYDYGRTKVPTVPSILRGRGPKQGTVSLAKNWDTDLRTYVSVIKEAHGDQWKRFAKTLYAEKIDSLRHADRTWYDRYRILVTDDRIKLALGEFLTTAKDIERRAKKFPPRTYTYGCRRHCDYHELCVSEYNGLDISGMIKRSFIVTEERYADEVEDLLGE